MEFIEDSNEPTWITADPNTIQETALPVLCTHRFLPEAVLLGRYNAFKGSAQIKGPSFQRALVPQSGLLGGSWVAFWFPWCGLVVGL